MGDLTHVLHHFPSKCPHERATIGLTRGAFLSLFRSGGTSSWTVCDAELGVGWGRMWVVGAVVYGALCARADQGELLRVCFPCFGRTPRCSGRSVPHPRVRLIGKKARKRGVEAEGRYRLLGAAQWNVCFARAISFIRDTSTVPLLTLPI